MRFAKVNQRMFENLKEFACHTTVNFDAVENGTDHKFAELGAQRIMCRQK